MTQSVDNALYYDNKRGEAGLITSYDFVTHKWPKSVHYICRILTSTTTLYVLKSPLEAI